MKATFGAQLGLDVFLTGTPQEMVKCSDAFPYSTCDCGSTFVPDDDKTRERNKIIYGNAVRRRMQPSCFEEACAYGNLPVVMWMCMQGGIDPVSRRALYESSDATPLMWAAFRGQLPIVRFLIDRAVAVNACNALGHTALHWAITAGKMDVVRFLLDHGADPWQRDNQGFDAAFVATHNNQLPVLVMLTEDSIAAGALCVEGGQYIPNVSATDADGCASRCYYLDPDHRDTAGHNLMHWAAYSNSVATCQYLVEYWGYAVDALDGQGRTPLHYAAREGFAEVIEYLLSRGADVGAVDREGCTAFRYAKSRGHPEALYVLESYPRRNTTQLGSSCGVVFTAKEQGAAGVTTLRVGANLPFENGAKGASFECDTEPCQAASILECCHRMLNSHAESCYIPVRSRRAMGTLRMMRLHPMFAFQAFAGAFYILMFYFFSCIIPPFFSYLPMWLYLLKNLLWGYLAPHRVQGGRPAPIRGRNSFLTSELVTNLAGFLRGTWVFRQREPSNLFAVLTLLGLQVAAWHHLGFVPFIFAGMSTSSNSDANLRTKTWQNTLSLQILDMKLQDIHRYVGGCMLECIFGNSADWMMKVVLPLLLGLTVASMFLTKCLSMRSVDKKCDKGTWQTSPLWRILHCRAYRWLHPRSYLIERHTRIPLRSFYCPERDVVIRRYDGYSILLDCPIGESNHLPFVVSCTCLALFEFFLFAWGLRQALSYMEATILTSKLRHTNTALSFASMRSLEEYISFTTKQMEKGPVMTTPFTNKGVLRENYDLLCIFAHLFVYGLPGRPSATLELARLMIEAASRPFYQRVFQKMYFFIFYCIVPTSSSAYGVCLFHTSFVMCIVTTYVSFRQWYGVWCGATRMELANPLAPGTLQDGALVSIFPPDSEKSVLATFDLEEERYYAEVDPNKAKKASHLFVGQSIYANGKSGFANIVTFLLCKQNGFWRNAVAISPHNTPRTKILCLE